MMASTGCSAPEAAPAAAAERAPYAAIAKGRIDVEGGVIKLAASRDGIIRQVFVEEGDHVRQGDVLATLDDRQARLQLALAESEVAQARLQLAPAEVRLRAAEREVRRLERLRPDDAVPAGELDQARDHATLMTGELDLARAAARTAGDRQRLARYEVEQRSVRAPLDGWIVRRTARPGDGVSTLNVTSLFLFAPEARRIVRAELEERWVRAVKAGQRAEIVPEADESEVLAGRVLRLGRVFGAKQPSDDPAEKVDARVIECVIAVDASELFIGQRVLVRIAPPDEAAKR